MRTFYRCCFNPRNTSYKFEVSVKDGETLVFGTGQPEPILVREGQSISISVELNEPWPCDVLANAEITRPEKLVGSGE